MTQADQKTSPGQDVLDLEIRCLPDTRMLSPLRAMATAVAMSHNTFDAAVYLCVCDKIVPGMYNAMVRLNIPSVYVSGGPMLAGSRGGDLISVFEGVGKHIKIASVPSMIADRSWEKCRDFLSVSRMIFTRPGSLTYFSMSSG